MIKPKSSKQILVTQEMLELTKQELKSSITSVGLDISAVDKKLDSMLSRMDARFEKLMSAMHEVKVLVEEQNSRNRFVLDGYSHVFHELKNLRSRTEKLEEATFGISTL